MTETTEIIDVWQFPMDFPFKVMGLHREGFVEEIVAVFQQHAPDDYSPSHTPSANGKYLSVTVMLRAESKEQIETLYEALRVVEGVKLVL